LAGACLWRGLVGIAAGGCGKQDGGEERGEEMAAQEWNVFMLLRWPPAR